MPSVKNDTLVELALASDANIFAAKYQLFTPSKWELSAQVEKSLTELKKGIER